MAQGFCSLQGQRRTKRHADERALVADEIDCAAGGRLEEDGKHSAEGQKEANLRGIPAAEGQIRSQKWANAGLYVGNPEVEPLEGAQATGRRSCFGERIGMHIAPQVEQR